MVTSGIISNVSNLSVAPSSFEDFASVKYHAYYSFPILKTKRYRKRKIFLASCILFVLTLLVLSVIEIGVRDYFFNYLKEQTDLLFNTGQIVVLKEENNKFCVIKDGECLSKRPTRVYALRRGLRRVGVFFSKPFHRRKSSNKHPTSTRKALSESTLILEDRINKIHGLKDRARAVHWPIDHNNLKRWIDVADFDIDDYQGLPLEKHIENTVEWREEFGACCIQEDEFDSSKHNSVFIEEKDRFGRPVLVFAPHEEGEFDVDVYLRLLVHNVEKAIRAMDSGVEKFAVVVDCSKFGFNSLPPASFFTSLFKILMAHYPARLGVVLVADASRSVQFLWKVVNAVLTERTRKKIFFLQENETARSMLDKISSDMVERKLEL